MRIVTRGHTGNRMPARGCAQPAHVLRTEILILLVGVGLLLVSPGCRTRPEITALEQENFALENTIYCLKDHLDKAHMELEQCREENARLREGSSQGQGGRSQSSGRGDAPGWPDSTEDRGPEVTLPQVELPGEETSPDEALRRLRTGPDNDDGAAIDSSAGNVAQAAYSRPTPVETTAEGVAAIAFDPRTIGGFEEDGRPGHDGIEFLLRPFDHDGNLVLAPAEISVAVIDPELPGISARIARWDLSRQDVRRAIADTPSAAGIRLRLPWPAEPPVHRSLQLFVRYTTEDGRQLQAQTPLTVNVPEYAGFEPAATIPRALPNGDPDGHASTDPRPLPAVQAAPHVLPSQSLPAAEADAAPAAPELVDPGSRAATRIPAAAPRAVASVPDAPAGNRPNTAARIATEIESSAARHAAHEAPSTWRAKNP